MQLDFFAPREKFAILEITPSGTSGFFMSVDDDRNLVFEKRMTDLDLKKSFSSPALGITQKSWEGQYLFKSHRKVIAIADSRIATTIPVPLELHRDDDLAIEALTLSEFENLIAQAMAKIFNRCRAEAATRLTIGELDTILVRAKAGHMKFDGKVTANPVGAIGKNIALLLELTFTRRETFESLKHFFSSPEEFFFVESAQVRLAVLAEVRPLPHNLIVANDDGLTSSLFILEKTDAGHPVLYRETIDWHSNLLIKAIMASLEIPQKIAEELYEAYRTGNASDIVTRHFEKMTDALVKKLFAEVAQAKIKGPTYLDMPHLLPFDLPHRAHGATFEETPLQEIMQKLGFSGDLHTGEIPITLLARYLPSFFGAYFEKDNSDINRKLRRRLHWLAE